MSQGATVRSFNWSTFEQHILGISNDPRSKWCGRTFISHVRALNFRQFFSEFCSICQGSQNSQSKLKTFSNDQLTKKLPFSNASDFWDSVSEDKPDVRFQNFLTKPRKNQHTNVLFRNFGNSMQIWIQQPQNHMKRLKLPFMLQGKSLKG